MENLTIASGVPRGVLVFAGSTGVHSLFRLACCPRVVENRSVMWYRTAFRAEAENGLVA
jgi:hypothetical protein